MTPDPDTAADRATARFFPGLGFRPLYLAVFCGFTLVVYSHQGATWAAPAWFLRASERLFDVPVEMFHRHLWSHASAWVLLMLVPMALVRAAEGWTPRDLGLRVRGAHRELLTVGLLWAATVPLIAWASSTPAFLETYPRLGEAGGDARLFALYEGLYLFKWVAWEFFFRGFMLFGFEKDLRGAAPIVSTLPYVVVHLGKPEAEMAGAVVGGFVLCFIALRSRSIWPGVLLHWGVATTLDFFASSWWR